MNFKICEDVSALGINAAFLVLHDIDNNHYDKPLKERIDTYYTKLIQSYSLESLQKDGNILGYRKLHEKISITDKNLIASPESLLKILFKHGSLRPINFIVDTYNYIAIKNKISIGAHDLSYINGNVRLCFTTGEEIFIPLGKRKSQIINNREYCYIDDSNEILCRLDCRQCDKTKTTTDTKDCLFIIQGNEDISIDLIESTANELLNIFSPYSTNKTKNILAII